MSIRTVRIAIEARVGEDEISGQIRSDVGPPGSFSGWLGLISALDGLLSHGIGADAAEGLGGGASSPGTTPRSS